MTLSSSFYSLVTLALLLSFVVKKKTKMLYPLALFSAVASPLMYYVLYEPGNATINALLLNVLIFLFYREVRDSNTYWKWFCFGLFHSLAFAIKVDTIFYVLLLGDIIYNEIFVRKRLEKIGNLVFYALGFLTILSIHFFNIYTILGVLSYGYSSTFLVNLNVLRDTFFSTYQGVFVNSPFFLLVFVLSIFSIHKLKNTNIYTFVALSIIAKALAYGLTYSHGSGIFGGRQFIPELPFFIMFLVYFYEKNISNKVINRNIFGLFAVVGVVWSFYLMLIYIGQQERRLPLIPYSNVMDYYFSYIIEPEKLWDIAKEYVFTLYSPLIKIVNFLPAFLFIFILFYLVFKTKLEKLCMSILAYLVVSYSFVTILNFVNGKKNIELLKEKGYYKSSLVGSGPLFSVYYENLGSIEERMLFLRDRNRLQELEYYQRLHDNIQFEILKEIISFPENENRDVRSYFREFDSHEKISK